MALGVGVALIDELEPPFNQTNTGRASLYGDAQEARRRCRKPVPD